MREIKFRAWADNVTRFGSLHEKDEPRMVYSDDSSMEEFACFYMDSDCTTKSIMQFIGLKDKNGKEIYEGDILQFSDKIEYYRKGLLSPYINIQKKEIPEDDEKYPIMRISIKLPEDYKWLLSTEIQSYWEIIGNIHQHKDLIK